jgi:trans-aconitate methyltransferase
MTLAEHWDERYRSTAETEVSWFEPEPTTSLALIDAVAPPDGPRNVIDVGAGASRLVDQLTARGDRVTVLDISAVALERHPDVDTIRADVRTWRPERHWDLWHDRAMLHFLTETDDRQRYAQALRQAVGPSGAFVLGVFAADGPDHCSGLPVHRFAADDLRALVGAAEVVDEHHTVHRTPGGFDQAFQWLAGRFAGQASSAA